MHAYQIVCYYHNNMRFFSWCLQTAQQNQNKNDPRDMGRDKPRDYFHLMSICGLKNRKKTKRILRDLFSTFDVAWVFFFCCCSKFWLSKDKGRWIFVISLVRSVFWREYNPGFILNHFTAINWNSLIVISDHDHVGLIVLLSCRSKKYFSWTCTFSLLRLALHGTYWTNF